MTQTLEAPATTFRGLREQATRLDIPGRGRMNKDQLHTAVSVALESAAHHPVVTLNDFPYVVHGPAETTVDTSEGHIAVEVTVTMARAVSAALDSGSAPFTGTRVEGRKGARIRRTRTGRVDYPAGKPRKGGRK